MSKEENQLDPNITLEELIQKANEGHKLAQYTLAKVREQQGDQKETLTWMSKAADAGFVPAQHELGMWYLLGHIVEFNEEKALGLLQGAMDAGMPDSLRLMSVLYGLGFLVEKDWEKAVDLLLKAADMVDANALRPIGFLLRTRGGDKKLADKLLKVAASMGEPTSIALVGEQPEMDVEKEIPKDWEKWKDVREFLLKLEDPKPEDGEVLSSDPTITKFEKVFSKDECTYLREMARPSLTGNVQLLGGDPNDENAPNLQNNKVMIYFPIVQDIAIILLNQRLARLADQPTDNAELLVVHNYGEGQEFKRHVDYMDPENPQQAFSIQQSGQRIKSVFLYMNDDYEGGETLFFEPDLKFKGKTGDVIILDNVNSIGLPEEKSAHASLPVKKGEKWLATLWVRDKGTV